METYSFLRAMADSWALLILVLIFVGVIVFVFRPGGRRAQKDAADSIFRNETRPARDDRKDDL
ncbi:cbb3-type cytochrome c oxidase subunit 3 [Paracoccus aestuarii]|uniref:Cbb3-type cytochrome c oxidase subunit 3 n=1 Tax=Paracoccus aestuarii TaxID=453842 RepID=A0A418ZPA3_9RHOB|nr:cbb3-type cytochrome c oxidase subunit 3 [Paracoccus aestuarii]RJK95240.1 cbb3-type cytochrome c oxidase subunit 3 [Paracoccus aestuarii]WCQ99647.1 cbb3-type cytochrome c oxidase subunit 3 [Paracoccus aestuarii]